MFNYLNDCQRDESDEENNESTTLNDIFEFTSTKLTTKIIFGFSILTESLQHERVLEFCVQNMRQQMYMLENNSFTSGEPQINDVSEVFKILLDKANIVDAKILKEHFSQFRAVLKPVVLYPNFLELFFVSCTKKSQFFHSYLEWRWNYLGLLLKLELAKTNSTDMKLLLTNSQFEIEFKMLLLDLIYIAAIRFENSNKPSLGCDCYKKVCNNLVKMAEKLVELHFFNTFDVHLREVLDGFHKYELMCTLWQKLSVGNYFDRLKKQAIAVKEKDLFNVFLICGLDFCFNGSTMEILNESFENYLKLEPSEDKMRQILLFLDASMTKNWEANVELLSFVWNCLSKRLNSTFSIQSSTLDAIIVME